MKKNFESAAGSIVGTDHRKPFVWKNNQDAFTLRQTDDLSVAVVADGCGEGAYSEFGARLGANMLAHRLVELFGSNPEGFAGPEALGDQLERLRTSMITSISELAQQLNCAPRSKTIIDNFLFTLIAFIITPSTTYVLGIGDGVYAINGEIFRIGPFERNEPPYLAYGGLVPSKIAPELCKFAVHKTVATQSLESIMVGTDGAGDILSVVEKTLPGKKELVGPLSQFWETDAFFKNPEGIRRRLNLINNSVLQPNWEERELNEDHGRLKDDTTLVVARRRKETNPPKKEEVK